MVKANIIGDLVRTLALDTIKFQRNLIKQTEIPAQLANKVPNQLPPLAPPSTVELNAATERVLNAFKSVFPSADLLGRELPNLIRLSQTNPQLLKSLNELLSLVIKNGVSEKIISQTVALVDRIVQTTEVSAQNKANSPNILNPAQRVGAPEKSPTQSSGVLTPTAVNTLSQPQRVINNQIQSHQWVEHIKAIIANQDEILRASQNTIPTSDVVQYLANSLEEVPATFEKELFALPILQKAGFKLTEMQILFDKAEPIKLALLIVKAAKNSPNELQTFVAELQTAIKEEKPLQPLLDQWEKKLAPPLPRDPQITTPKNTKILPLSTSSEPVIEGEKAGVYLQGLSSKEGVLPDTAWKVTPNMADISIRGSILASHCFPAGTHPLKFSVSDEDGEENWFDFLLYVVKGNEDEEPKKEKNEKQKEQFQQSKSQDLNEEESEPEKVSGSINISLTKPFILTTPYNPKEKIPAPLQVAFHFLADFVDPQFKSSRKNFLTFANSTEAGMLRKAVQNLQTAGPKGLDKYLSCLEVFFRKLESMIKTTPTSFEKAKHFLKDEVTRYFSGEKSTPSQFKMVEGSKAGDVMASICCTTGGLYADSGDMTDAIICFNDATKVAVNKPYFLQKLDTLFSDLRQKYLGKKDAPRFDLPILPPPSTLFSAKKTDPIDNRTKIFSEQARVVDAVC